MRIWLAGFALLLAGCATVPVTRDAATGRLLHDHLFAAPAQRVGPELVFARSDSMRHYLGVEIADLIESRGRQRALYDALYSKKQLKIEYDAAMTRNAAEAFDARIARHGRVVFDLELFLAVERVVEGALAAPGLDEIGDLDPEVVAHRVAAREHQVGAHALRRRGEEVVVKQAARGGIARDGHRGASGEQQGKPSQPNPHGRLRQMGSGSNFANSLLFRQISKIGV